MERNEPIRAEDAYKKYAPSSTPAYSIYHKGEVVTLKLTGEKLLILKPLEPDDDEQNIGDKYLTRTEDHKKKVVFACEIYRASENGKNTAQATR